MTALIYIYFSLYNSLSGEVIRLYTVGPYPEYWDVGNMTIIWSGDFLTELLQMKQIYWHPLFAIFSSYTY